MRALRRSSSDIALHRAGILNLMEEAKNCIPIIIDRIEVEFVDVCRNVLTGNCGLIAMVERPDGLPHLGGNGLRRWQRSGH